jgi:hypothetical protein
VYGVCPALLIHGNSRHEVQLQESKVGEVVLGQRFVLQMGVDATETLEASPTRSILLKVGDHDPLVGADDHVGDPSSAINEKTYLASDFKRKLAYGLGEF